MAYSSSSDTLSLKLKSIYSKLSIFITVLCQYMDYYLEKSFICLTLQSHGDDLCRFSFYVTFQWLSVSQNSSRQVLTSSLRIAHGGFGALIGMRSQGNCWHKYHSVMIENKHLLFKNFTTLQRIVKSNPYFTIWKEWYY